MKTQFIAIRFIIILVILLLGNGCYDSSTSPIAEGGQTGLEGNIVDSTGNPIVRANIFCLYYLNYVPVSPVQLAKTDDFINNITVFDFYLYQNFPNPFSSSSYIRFTLPQECEIELKIREKNTLKTIFQYHEVLPYGIYQLYLDNIVDSLNFRNGVHIYTLQAKGKDGKEYSSERALFIISNLGKPNATSNINGEYFFDYKQAFVGDSVVVNPDGSSNYSYTIILDNNINLLIEKEGYISKIVNIDLYPEILLRHDIVLMKEN
jgi:hypothetical protein